MKSNLFKRAVALLLTLVCVLGVLPLSALAADGLSTAPSSITQKNCDYVKIGGQLVTYKSASSVVNSDGLPHVFDEQVEVPGYGTTRALCAYHRGRLGSGANGQKWNFKNEVDNASLKVILTFVYAYTYRDYTDAGNAAGLDNWGESWTNLWFMVAQGMSWYYEYGIIKDVTSDREGFIEQVAEEFVAALKMCHDTYHWAPGSQTGTPWAPTPSSTATTAALPAFPPTILLPPL